MRKSPETDAEQAAEATAVVGIVKLAQLQAFDPRQQGARRLLPNAEFAQAGTGIVISYRRRVRRQRAGYASMS